MGFWEAALAAVNRRVAIAGVTMAAPVASRSARRRLNWILAVFDGTAPRARSKTILEPSPQSVGCFRARHATIDCHGRLIAGSRTGPGENRNPANEAARSACNRPTDAGLQAMSPNRPISCVTV